MFIDHFAHIFGGTLVFALSPVMRGIGRLAFPIFVYFIGEGFRRTSNVEKYLTRLGLFALISEIPFDMALNNSWSDPLSTIVWLEFGSQNILFTLFLGLLAAHFYKKTQDSRLFALLLPIPFVLAIFARADYGLLGVILVFLCAVIEGKAYRLAVLLAGGLWLYIPFGGTFAMMLMTGHITALGLIALYSEEQGPQMKWLFYLFYPLHMLLLFGLALVIY